MKWNDFKESFLIYVAFIASGAVIFFITQKYFAETFVIPVQKVERFEKIRIEKPKPLGNESGVNFIYFYRYDCVFCKNMNNDISQIYSKYNNEVSFYFLNVLDVNNQDLYEASIASQCILKFEKEKYFSFSERIYNQTLLEVEQQNLESKNGYQNEFSGQTAECILLEETNMEVLNFQKIANYYGITGTPSIIIDDNLIVGKVSFRILDAILKEYAQYK